MFFKSLIIYKNNFMTLFNLLCKKLYSLAFLFAFLSGSLFAQDHASQIETLLDSYHEYGQFNGSALVAKNSTIIYKNGHGLANMEWNIPNKSNTKHRIGSITKQFTSMLIMQLVEAGKLDLHVPINTYLPDYPKETGSIITLHHLMTHTSGIPNYTSFSGFMKESSRDPYTPVGFVEMFADSTLNFKPGEKFSYSNSGYFLLGVVIEEVTEKTYEQALQEMIFDPLKMNNTGFDHHDEIINNRAAGYEKNGMEYVNADYLDMSIPYAAGSMYATVEDLFKWDQALYGYKILNKSNTELMFQEHIPAWRGTYGYGWGLDKIPLGESTDTLSSISHGGGINGFNTIIVRIPSQKSLVVLFNNTGGASLTEMSLGILNIINDQPYDNPKKSAVRELSDKIEKDGLASGMAWLAKAKSNEEEYDFDEGDFNNLGYNHLGNDKVENALAIFKFNMEHFPKSWNAQDSYAEALMTNGNNEDAISYYKKSLEMNPANQNGIDMLKKMGVNMSDVVKDFEVASEILQTYIGSYELMPGFVLAVTLEGNQLSAQATGQPIAPIFAKTENVFYLKSGCCSTHIQ